MPPTQADLKLAVVAYWEAKNKQLAAAEQIGAAGELGAKAVRAGAQFAPIISLISRFFTDAGYPVESIGITPGRVTLPSHFRPNKQWDLVVVHDEVLVAAIEMKALGGPYFGNNYNNRVEEAIGSSIDLSRAHLEGLTGPEKPWLGYFFLMNDEEGSRRPCVLRTGPYPVEDVWRGRSYQERFELTGTRLLDEGFYDAVCYLVSSEQDPEPVEPVPRLDWRHFSAAIRARIEYLAGLGYPR